MADQHKKINGPLSNDELLSLLYTIELMYPSLKYLITRSYYRKAFVRKLSNLLSHREFKSMFKLVNSAFMQPLMNSAKKYNFA